VSRWFENQRIAWIAEMLLIYGFINREHLVRKFGISVPQASKDLSSFAKNSSGGMVYDLSKKCYVRPSHKAGKAGR
jgi:DeoR/GlpR family transcriptional regulator of sugar metabolism